VKSPVYDRDGCSIYSGDARAVTAERMIALLGRPGPVGESWHLSLKGSPILLQAMGLKLAKELRLISDSVDARESSRQRGRDHWGS
jgi:hypothetical protein